MGFKERMASTEMQQKISQRIFMFFYENTR